MADSQKSSGNSGIMAGDLAEPLRRAARAVMLSVWNNTRKLAHRGAQRWAAKMAAKISLSLICNRAAEGKSFYQFV